MGRRPGTNTSARAPELATKPGWRRVPEPCLRAALFLDEALHVARLESKPPTEPDDGYEPLVRPIPYSLRVHVEVFGDLLSPHQAFLQLLLLSASLESCGRLTPSG